MPTWKQTIGCREYGTRLEARLVADLNAEMDAGLQAHMAECVQCSEAMETALLASQLVRQAQRPSRAAGSEAFVTRVMAAIRMQESLLVGPSGIWRPIELFASRAALGAALALLGLSFFVAQFAPQQEVVLGNGQLEIGAGLPERPILPVTEDEILLSLADMTDGI